VGNSSEGKDVLSRSADVVLMALVALAVVAIGIFAAILLLNALPEQTPTEVVPADDSWERVKAAGKIVVGTSADYPPFEYYIGRELIDGFDIALMDEIARRLGVKVEYREYAFDALGDALARGRIDAAIAAISVSPERAATMDFTDAYWVTLDAILAYFTSPVRVNSVVDLAGHRVGVQRGSIYETWLRRDLVGTELTSGNNLIAYEDLDQAISDLTGGRIDFVAMDLPPARVLDQQVGLKIVGQGLNQQSFAVALPKGASALRQEINLALGQLRGEGKIAQLAWQYLELAPGELWPTSTVTPRPEVPGTPYPQTTTPRPGASSTATPSVTPQPTSTPELPVIQSFSVSPNEIAAGECVAIAWSAGSGASGVRILRDSTVIVDNGGLEGQQADCPDQAGSYTYRLEAYNALGQVVSQDQMVTVTGNPLVGTQWQVISYYDPNNGGGMASVLSGTSLTAAFGADGMVNGSAGCNSYSARYVVDGSLLAITPPTSTLRVCETPQGIMGQETAFLAALVSAGSFAIDGNQLNILNASGQVVLTLSEQ
jgi:polar amino acid transport system substrate-binding protein